MKTEISTTSKKSSGLDYGKAKKPVGPTKVKKPEKQVKPAVTSKSQNIDVSSFLADMSAAEPGLIIVNANNSSLLMVVRAVFEGLITTQEDKLCLPVPRPLDVLSIVSGKPRQIEQTIAWLNTVNLGNSKMPLEYMEFPGFVSFNWFSGEGHLHLTNYIEPGLLITVEQKIGSSITPATLHFINRINNEAKQKDAWVIAFTNCPSTYDVSGLHNMCDDYFEVTTCEPDPDVDMAFCIDCAGISEMGILSNGKTMCSVTKVEGELKVDFQPFISRSLKTRVMWILRGQKMSFANIGKKFKVNASTVLRQLDDLPKPYNINPEKAWLECCYELLEIETSDVKDEDDDDE